METDLKTTEKNGNNLKFPLFEDNKVSTKTIIAVTNLNLDISKLYLELPITPFNVYPKRRGRKRKNNIVDVNTNIPSGSIITVKFEDTLRGVDLKQKSKSIKKKNGKYFRNSITVVMIINDKNINFKVSKNGKFQMTGCKTDEQAFEAIKFFWKYIKPHTNIYTIKEINSINSTNSTETTIEPNVTVIFVPAMRNIDFELGFLVDREKLSRYINLNTEYFSLLETSFGYTGVNIKFPMNEDLTTLNVAKLEFIKDDWVQSAVPYTDHFDMISEKEKIKKINKPKFNTFLCFHSGKLICSGMTAEFMRSDYYKFLDIIRNCYTIIQETLEH